MTFYGLYFSQKLTPEVVRYPHFEVPYPQLKRGQQSLGALVAVVRSSRYIYVLRNGFVLISVDQETTLEGGVRTT